MKSTIFPGTSDPQHQGHQRVLEKALKVFVKKAVVESKLVANSQGLNHDLEPILIIPDCANINYSSWQGRQWKESNNV